ncbi:MAG: hypothetical protein NZ551_02895 [Microscillaceae bacterium]|nr:hypothetical protein [Microscillaceae bacterium]MDW8460135.1 hypothetical protein [Cytophagales bacterium]
MKKCFNIILILLFFTQIESIAQPNTPKRIELIRLKFIKERLNLKTEQIAKFEELYLQYIRKKREILLAERNLRNVSLTATDEELNKNVDTYIKLKKQEGEVEAEYKEKFLKVINIRQLAEMYNSEREFLKTMLQRVGNRRLNNLDNLDDLDKD